MKKVSLIFLAMLLLTSIAVAKNPVLVGPTGDYPTIEDAIDSWCEGGENTAEIPPFVIEIDPAGSYDESLTLNDAWTSGAIVGDLEMKSSVAGTPAIIKLQTGISGGSDGLHVYQSRFDITFTDLLFCPSLTNPVTDDFVKIDENSTTTPTTANRIEFIDCIFTDVDAAGDPAVLSKADIIAMDYPSSLTAFTSGSSFAAGDMLMKWWGDAGENLSGKIENCGFFIKTGYCARVNLDGSAGESFEIKDTVFATGADWHAALQAAMGVAGQTFTITGSLDPCAGDLDKCTAILSAGWHAIWAGGPSGASLTIDNVLVDNEDVFGSGSPCRVISHGSADLYVEDCILNTRGSTQFLLDYPTNTSVPDTFKRTTLHREDAAPGAWLYTGSLPDPGGIQFIDCVFSGNGHNDWTGADPGQGVELINCVVATTGADAVTTLGTTAKYTDCKFIDPMYASKDRTVEGYMDPTNTELVLAGTDLISGTYGGISLGGGGDYSGADASDIANNAFKDWGDCEGQVFTIPSGRSNWAGADLAGIQKQERGVIGLGLLVNHTSGRLEAGSDAEDISGFTDGDETLSFYYKMPIITYSYPRLALRLDPAAPPFTSTGGQVGDCAAYVEWTNTAFTQDSNWHLFRPEISSLDFDTASTANFFINNYAVSEWWIDEIVLTDTFEPQTEVRDWGLY